MGVTDRAKLAETLLTDPRYRKLAGRNLNNDANLEDVLQEVAQVVLEHFPPDHPKPTAWLTLTLKRRCWKMNQHPKESRTFPTDPTDWGTAIGNAVGPCQFEALEDVERIAAIKPHLKADELTALMDQVAGYSYRETSQRRGWTNTKVNRCLTEGRAKLRAVNV